MIIPWSRVGAFSRNTMTSQPIVAGIDVGSRRKGFHAVALHDGIYLARLHALEVEAVVAWCGQLQVRVIGIDAPCRWSADGRARPAERQLMAQGIQCFATPTRERALGHPRNYYGWMLSGEALYRAIEPSHPLCAGIPLDPVRPCCFETFPHAICRALAAQPVSARHKATQRRQLLARVGVESPHLTSIDWIDAALCAVAAHRLAAGRSCTAYGEPATGLIIVPGQQRPGE